MELYEYQKPAVDFLCDPRFPNRLLADDMGVGKTLSAVHACRRLGASRILVLCPATVKQHWANTFRGEGYTNVGVNSLNTSVCIWNYDHLSRSQSGSFSLYETIKRMNKAGSGYDVLILDEAHYLASGNSKRTQRVLGKGTGLYTVARKVFALTGTPILSGPRDFYPLLNALWPDALYDCHGYEAYARKFCAAHFEGSHFEDSGASEVEELALRLNNFMFRRTRQQVLGDWVPPSVYKITAPIDLQRLEFDQENHITARRVSAESKTPEALETIAAVLKHHGNLVVFAHHRNVLQQIVARFPMAAIIEGGQSIAQRKQMIDSFVRGFRKLAVVQIRAGGTGLDGLQAACSTGMFLEQDWTPAQIDQAMGRLDRNGQLDECTFYFVEARGSDIESRMRAALERKRAAARGILK